MAKVDEIAELLDGIDFTTAISAYSSASPTPLDADDQSDTLTPVQGSRPSACDICGNTFSTLTVVKPKRLPQRSRRLLTVDLIHAKTISVCKGCRRHGAVGRPTTTRGWVGLAVVLVLIVSVPSLAAAANGIPGKTPPASVVTVRPDSTFVDVPTTARRSTTPSPTPSAQATTEPPVVVPPAPQVTVVVQAPVTKAPVVPKPPVVVQPPAAPSCSLVVSHSSSSGTGKINMTVTVGGSCSGVTVSVNVSGPSPTGATLASGVTISGGSSYAKTFTGLAAGSYRVSASASNGKVSASSAANTLTVN